MLAAGLVGFGSASPALADVNPGDTESAAGSKFGTLAECGDVEDVELRPGGILAGEAHWTVGCPNSTDVEITGWSEDHRSDGLCVQVYALIGSTWHYGPRSCPNGNVDEFELSGSGRPIEVYARLIA
ncbi:hypothetical protein [Micromonospora sp. NPDC023737]|uniref:hypothetical protein n=1 Tax=unclassified Micromonospora TaxID=2617518 RepID=UPI0033DCFFB2